MRQRSDSKRARLQAYLDQANAGLIDETVWTKLVELLAPISTGYLRQLLRASGHPLAPIVEGARFDSLDEAARTLSALSAAYSTAGRAERRQIRKTVIESKDRLRWSIKPGTDNPHGQAAKGEMLLWTMTWLENPEVFPSWLSLRRPRTDDNATESESTPL